MPDASNQRKNVTYSAPVGSIDLAAEAEDGTPYEIWPCHDCLPWHAEVIQDGDEVAVREWHAIDCPQFQGLVNGAAG
ncbi:hypothetical protein AB0E08_05545 [Streptomyces sp. NPDC048281]|uniref:hypothetical protein n=1 Tax=Streptomyces sp. NPDC048281 TaxID=3154715 RepID=UPI0034398973